MRYRAFISYSHADAATAAWLHRKLEGWRTPRRMRAESASLPERLSPIFRDREDLASAGELGPQIQAALADSEALIVLCSPEAAHSHWVDEEVRAFRASGRGERVFALIVAGEPHSGDARECFPPALRESEPLAADLRAGKDGRELALLKLISGLLGVPLDALRQREARRRHQRMLAVTTLSLAVMLLTSFLAVQAVIAQRAAERRQKQAEALVDFMLGDLNDKLSEVSRLDILEGVHDHAMDYFASLPEDDVTDEALEQRAHAFSRIGSVRLDQGHLDKAMVSYSDAARLSARLAQAQPGNVPRQLAYAEALAFIGMVHWYQGDLDQAQRGFDGAQAVLLRAQRSAPRNTELLYQLATLDNNAGHVLEGRGRLDQASAHYRRMRESARELVAIDAANVDWQNQLGLAHNNLAKMALLNGDLAAAVSGYRADVAIEDAMARKDPRNNAQAERLLLARGALGRTLPLTGDLDAGADSLQQALASAQRLQALEPDSAGFQEDVALYATQLARLRRLQARRTEAEALVATALRDFDALLAKNAEHPGWLRGRAEARLEQAALAPDGARTALAAALAVLERQLADSPQDRGALLDTVQARLQLGGLESADAASARWRLALAACDGAGSGTRDPRLRALRIELLLRLQQRERAAADAVALWRDGFRDEGFAASMRAAAIALPAAPAANLTARHPP